MSIEAKEITVEVEKEAPEPDKEVVVAGTEKAEGATKSSATSNVDFEALRTQLAAVTAREEAALSARVRAEQLAQQREREVTEAKREAAQAKGEVVDSKYQSIVAAIASATTESDSATREYRSARELGDIERETAAQVRLADARAALRTLNDGKAALEEQAAQAKARSKDPPAREANTNTGDPVETRIANFTPRTQDWIRSHKEVLTDIKLGKRAQAAHLEAEADGYVPDTDAYFQYMDKRLGFSIDDTDGETGKVNVRSHVRTPPAAPPSRDTNVANGRLTGQTVKLTAREVEMADQLGITASEYARRKLIMSKEGRYATMVLQ